MSASGSQAMIDVVLVVVFSVVIARLGVLIVYLIAALVEEVHQ